MKAFLIGLIFLISVFVLAGIGILLYPFIFMLGIMLRFVISFLLIIFAIWLLGKLMILVWELLRSKRGERRPQ